MGWFDKKSWQKRRKIKDLQSDLIKAEKEGRFVVEQGLFFAELEDMGEATMMAFAGAEEMSGSEDTVIRQFFDRNGFSVEILKLDRSHTGLADVEIIPPEEMTRWVGRILKAEGYKLIDDSEEERPAELERQILPLSAMVRAMLILFAGRAQLVIATTRIKMNKEGNRLLQWMPKIAACLQAKVDPSVVELMRGPFEDAFDQFYLRIGTGREFDRSGLAKPAAPTDAARIPGMAFPNRPDAPAAADTPQPTPFPATPGIPSPAGAPNHAPAPTASPDKAFKDAQKELMRLHKACDGAESLTRIYRGLIRANSSRSITNGEAILKEVQDLFQAAAVCVMVKVPNGHGLTIHAQAGKKLVWGEGGDSGYPVSATVLGTCIKTRAAVTNMEDGREDPTASMVQHDISATAAVPIIVGSDGTEEIVGILYLDRRGGSRPFTEDDCDMLVRISQVFRDFSDLTLGLREA